MRSSVQLRPFQAQQSVFKTVIVRKRINRACIVASQVRILPKVLKTCNSIFASSTLFQLYAHMHFLISLFQQAPIVTFERSSGLGPVVSRVLGATAAAIILATAPASFAELETVPPDQVTTLAKPLKVQTVDKNRIWLLFILGATTLFGTTVLAENNESWFPAISKANKALAASAAAAKERARKAEEEQLQFEERLAEVKQETTMDSRMESAVAEGLSKAKRPPPTLSPPIDVEIEEKEEEEEEQASASNASNVAAAAAVEEAQINEEAAKYPAKLGHEDDDEVIDDEVVVEEVIIEAGTGVEEIQQEGTSAADASRAAPLFEISGEQIEASAKNYQQREVLNELSIEDLQRELEERKKSSAGNNGSSGGNN